MIEGVYPAKPASRPDLANSDEPIFVGGNEGLAEVTDIGDGVSTLTRGDWVVMIKQQSGTWTSAANVDEGDVIRVPIPEGQVLSPVHGATMTVRSLLLLRLRQMTSLWDELCPR